MTGEGRKESRSEGIIQSQNMTGMSSRGVRGSSKKFLNKKTKSPGRKTLDRLKRFEKRTNRHRERGVSVGKKGKRDARGGE